MTTTQTTRPAPAVESGSRFGAVRRVLTDPEYDRSDRLIRLQGWRGDDAVAARQAGAALRLGPAACSTLAFAVAITGSLPLAAATLTTTVVGVFAANHPFETAYNAFARRTGRTPIPTNRAAKRLACLIGTMFFAAITIALLAGNGTVASTLAIAMGSVAAFVAVTGICVPSIMFTFVRGVRRSTARSVFAR